MDKELIKALIKTLNEIEVCGKPNLDKLLGCIMVLEQELKRSDVDG